MRANCLPGRSCNASFLSLEGARNCARMHACAHTPSNLERFYARMHSCMQKGMKPHSSSTQLSLRFAARIMAACTLPAQQSSAASWDARGPRCARCARELRAIIAPLIPAHPAMIAPSKVLLRERRAGGSVRGRAAD